MSLKQNKTVFTEEFKSESFLETEALGIKIGKTVPDGSVVALFGELGAGKTAFVRGFVAGAGIDADVSSPTFAIVNEYRADDKVIYHFDMYRVSRWDDLYSTGYFDYIDSGSTVIIEWSENIESALPDDCIRIAITKTENENERIFEISGSEKFDFTCH
ncbi:MAG: tRNA (adenosine(37)-N6)-threonylcarbamoyltransferase complex ATPase subunit type 1 TsaE [Clostridia bacterium]|nr:tRNA (adenosine(37)-N6)-threonylcarbamoyltransferase complex ATPase subunit type 1 TsaE [Clostridia bacterium]